LKKIVILTSTELRHKYFRVFLSQQNGIQVLKTFSEDGWTLKKQLIDAKSNLKEEHLNLRNKSEISLLKEYCDETKDNSNNFTCKKDYLSTENCLKEIKTINPDLIVVYGTSLLAGDILNEYSNKIINVHLGLSPYYRGSGSNYFPFVNNEPEYAGATFMFLDKGIDTGNIIHQIRPVINLNDDYYKISAKFIVKMTTVYTQIIKNFDKVKIKKLKPVENKNRFYNRADFSDESIKKLKSNFENEILSKYLKEKNNRDKKVPIITQDWMI